MDLFLY